MVLSFPFTSQVGQLQNSARSGSEESPQGAAHPRASQRRPDPGKTPAYRNIPGDNVLHQQRG